MRPRFEPPRTRHRGSVWEVVLEPDEEAQTVVVVTAYARI